MVLGRNSPVKSTTNVESNVSHVTRTPSLNAENSVAAAAVALCYGIDPEATFKGQFISSDLKMMKPAPEFYRYVIQRIGLPPQEILFIDDNKANVDGARAVGLDARLYNPGTDLGLLLSDC